MLIGPVSVLLYVTCIVIRRSFFFYLISTADLIPCGCQSSDASYTLLHVSVSSPTSLKRILETNVRRICSQHFLLFVAVRMFTILINYYLSSLINIQIRLPLFSLSCWIRTNFILQYLILLYKMFSYLLIIFNILFELFLST